MKLEQLIVLLPCHSLEDFTLSRSADEAEQLLACWSTLWHPALLDEAQAVPSWRSAEDPPQETDGCLFTMPDCSGELVPSDWVDRAKASGAVVLNPMKNRLEMVGAALEHLDSYDRTVEPELVADFHALGYGHLVVELLTRQLRYMSNLDEEAFKSSVLLAAKEAMNGDVEAAKTQLQAAFDLLHESREYFYPVESHLLDLTLVAPTTLGGSLRSELAGQFPTNLLVTAEVVQRMAQEEPTSLQALIEALANNRAAIVGGGFAERELPLLSHEAILHDLSRGVETYEELLQARPTVFGRRKFGLTPLLPGMLKKLGFSGALHCTLDDGRFPVGNQSRIQWEGIDRAVLETVGRVPIDVSRADAFLRLSERLGDAMDLDHVATIVLAHWPGQSSPWYEDLRRIANYSTVLGTFSTIDDYFDETGFAGQQTSYSADQYRSPYLIQEVAAGRSDPISRWPRYYARRARLEATQTLAALATLVLGSRSSDENSLPGLEDSVEQSLDATANDGSLDERLQDGLDRAMARFTTAVAGSTSDQSCEGGYLIANPCSFSRRVCQEFGSDKAMEVVDLPAMGFARVTPGPAAAAPSTDDSSRKGKRLKKKPEPPLAEENVLRNDFFSLSIDPHTGSIRSISDYYSRGARIAQQIALRRPRADYDSPDDDAHYSIMAADAVEVTSSGPLLGEIVSRGRLVDRNGQRLASFVQTTRVRRGSRVIEVIIDLDPECLPDPDPWNSYYAARFAWHDATANLYRNVGMVSRPTDAVQLEAPQFVDIRSSKSRTTLLTGGLPYHRRFGLRKLDTLLLVHGETARRFRLGIGIDLPNPVAGAIDFLAPSLTQPVANPSPTSSGWLFHLDARNVIATHWEPLLVEDRVEGFRARLLETDGQKTELSLRSFRPIRSAEKINPSSRPRTELTTKEDQITLEMGPHEWAEIEARFV